MVVWFIGGAGGTWLFDLVIYWHILYRHKLFIGKQPIVGWTTSVEPNVESKKEAGHEIQSRLAW